MLSQQYMLKFSACYEFVPGFYECQTNTPGLEVPTHVWLAITLI